MEDEEVEEAEEEERVDIGTGRRRAIVHENASSIAAGFYRPLLSPSLHPERLPNRSETILMARMDRSILWLSRKGYCASLTFQLFALFRLA